MRAVVRVVLVALAVLAGIAAVGSASASASNGIEHLDYAAGPYEITPGANLILAQYNHVPKPAQDGFMVRMAPNLRLRPARREVLREGAAHQRDPPAPRRVAQRRGGRRGRGAGPWPVLPVHGLGRGEDDLRVPARVRLSDRSPRPLGPELHDSQPHVEPRTKVYITYDIDFVPATSPLAATITPVHPIWMDVEAHHIYPVFNVQRGSGRNGKFTFPDMAKAPYGSGPPLNAFTIDHPGTLIGTAGHLHPGGLYDDLDLIRAGATATGGATAGAEPHSVHLFRSNAQYFGKRAPVSWDVAMTVDCVRTGGLRFSRATCCASVRPTTRGSHPGTR